MKTKLLKLHNATIIVLLSLLGFTSCGKDPAYKYGTPVPEYGVPEAVFIDMDEIKITDIYIDNQNHED
jgi:hypothetical protein